MDWFAFGPRASNGSIDGAPSDQWSSSKRALRVSQSDTLQALLNAEIHKSGFLTSAGHRAVVQNFLHSDAVDEEMAKARDEEMAKARDAKPQEGLFRRLVSSGSATSGTGGGNSLFRRLASSDGTTSSTGNSLFRRLASSDSMASCTGSILVVENFPYNDEVDEEMTNPSDAKPQEGLFRRLASSGSTTSNTGTANSLFRRLDSSESTASINGSVNSSRARRRGSRGISSALRRLSGDLAMEIDFDPKEEETTANIAPRRASHQRLPPYPARGGAAEEETMGNGRLRRPLIVKTKPPAHCEGEAPANCEDEAPAPFRPDESWRSSEDTSHDEVLDSLRRTFGSWRRSSDGSADPTFSRSLRSDEDSCADECGWLPWPSEGDDDAPDDDVHMVSMENMQLQED